MPDNAQGIRSSKRVWCQHDDTDVPPTTQSHEQRDFDGLPITKDATGELSNIYYGFLFT